MSRWISSLRSEFVYFGLEKVAEEGGHWRKLPPGHKGKDKAGGPQVGRTWVRKSRMKSFFTPYPHQKEFIRRVTTFKPEKGVIAAHGTGTGKTVSSVAAFEELKEQKKATRALVVVPAGLRQNFLKEGVNKFTDSKIQTLFFALL